MGFRASQPATDPKTGDKIPNQYDEDPNFKELLDYQADLEAKITTKTAKFTKNRIYRKENGELSIQTAKSILKAMGNKIEQLSTWDDIKNISGIRSYFFEENGRLRNFDNKVNKERISEYIQRRERFSQLKRDMASGGKKSKLAKETLIRNLLICGYNESEMLQQKQTDNGEVIVWPHNKPMNEIMDAYKKGKLNITIPKNAHFAKFSIGGVEVMRFAQGGTWSGSSAVLDPDTGELTKKNTKTRQTRSTSIVSQEYLSNPSFLKESGKLSSKFHEFLVEQQKIIEKLIN